MRVLVVEDEQDLRRALVEQLRDQGYAVDEAADGRDGLHLATEYPLDLAIIDLGLPQLSGLELIRRLRSQGKRTPVLILTARSRWQEKVEGLEAGADDYLTKPFQFEELLARARALMRRSAGWAESALAYGDLMLNMDRQSVTLQGQPLELTQFEYKVLEYLMLHPGRVVSKTELSDHIYNEDMDRDSNVIEVFVGRLRRKIDPHNQLKPIETLRGRGYRWTLEKSQ
jgi:two-component system, OmpR family, response regulator PhoP